MPTTVTPYLLRSRLSPSGRPTASRGRDRLDHGVVVVELDEVEHPAGDQVRDPLAHVVLGQHDVVGADPLQDPGRAGG